MGGFSYADTLDSAKGLGPELGPSEATAHGETTASQAKDDRHLVGGLLKTLRKF